ncbi:MAG: alkaline phosphatase family protein, partial [Rhodoferax sp.]|nr:alkaline phosphatase family protein [Rhodoferax sp.]
CATTTAAAGDKLALQRIHNVVVIYAENHSFDNLYGLFPGANGIAQATPRQRTQLDHDGQPLPELVVFGRDGKPDAKYPRLPNGPFRIDAAPVNRPPTVMVPSPIHDYFHQQEQINGGQNNLFAAMSNVGGWSMGYYDGSPFKLWQWAREYTLADNFFQAAFGGSYLNHHWLICACTPKFANAPDTMRVRLDANGKLEKRPTSPSAASGAVQIRSDGLGRSVTVDGWSVNTSQPPYQPSGIPPASDGPATHADPQGVKTASHDSGLPVPAQTATTISLVMLVVCALGIGGAVAFSRTVVKPLDNAVRVSQAVAGGDLTVATEVRGKDEIAQLLNALHGMQMSLSRVVSNVRSNANSVAAASSEIAHAVECEYVIINQSFANALTQFAAIISAARCRFPQQ